MDQSEQTALGLKPQKYAQITYFLMLAGGAFSLLVSFAMIFGMVVPLGWVGGLASIAALIMALLGVFAFKTELGEIIHSHMAYIAILFGVFFVLGIVIVGIIFTALNGGLIISLISILLGAAQLALFYAGYTLWKDNERASVESVKARCKSLLTECKRKA